MTERCAEKIVTAVEENNGAYARRKTLENVKEVEDTRGGNAAVRVDDLINRFGDTEICLAKKGIETRRKGNRFVESFRIERSNYV